MRPHRDAVLIVPPLERVGLLADRLIVVEDSVLDDEEIFGLYTLVVVANRRARTGLGAIAADVHELGSIHQLAEHLFGRRNEAGAGVVRFVAERTIELGWMSDRLVDREPQVRRVKD